MKCKCRKCREDKKLDDMCIVKGKNRGICKKCHALEEKKRRDEMSEAQLNKIRQQNREAYHQKKNKIIKDGLPIDEQIKKWIRAQLARTGRNRKSLSFDILVKKCYEAKSEYPYISFLNIKELGVLRANFASIDKINPEKGYIDNNIQVVPLWLNSAKLDQTSQELIVKMVHFLKKEGVMG